MEFSQRQVCVFENETARYDSWDGRKRVTGGDAGSEVNMVQKKSRDRTY